ncbi:permease [Microbacterium sp. BWT-B31]|uniref:purine-cytosine permease family protein n=1 Tax=Microbacterium sp. BWT-B31 TaxID=3232072 RepID=UPI0035280E69
MDDDVSATDTLARQGDDQDQMSRRRLAMAWYGTASAFFFVYIGAAMASAYGSVNAFIGIVLSILAYGAINMVLSKYALLNRTTVAQFSRTILGRAGSAIAMVIFALIAIYYAVFEGSIVVFAFQEAFGGPYWLWALIVVAYSTPLVIGGARRFLDKINGILMPIYFFGLIAAVVWAGAVYGSSDAWATHPAPEIAFASGGPGWLATFAGYMGIWIMMMFTTDFAALGRRKDVRFHQWVTFGPLFYVLAYGFAAFVGIFLTFTIPGLEVSETGVAGGIVKLMGVLGLIVIISTQTRINTANYFLGYSNLQAFGERVLRVRMPTIVWVLLSSAIIYLLMLLPVVQYLLIALAWQGVLVTAWVAIAVVHIVLGRGRNHEHAQIGDHHYRALNANGLIAWSVATVIGLALLQLGAIDPAFAEAGATWGPLLTASSAALIYAVLWRANPRSRTGLIATISDH